jgi:hypothetical protein
LFHPTDEAQALPCLRATKVEIALLLTLGRAPSLAFFRSTIGSNNIRVNPYHSVAEGEVAG